MPLECVEQSVIGEGPHFDRLVCTYINDDIQLHYALQYCLMPDIYHQASIGEPRCSLHVQKTI